MRPGRAVALAAATSSALAMNHDLFITLMKSNSARSPRGWRRSTRRCRVQDTERARCSSETAVRPAGWHAVPQPDLGWWCWWWRLYAVPDHYSNVRRHDRMQARRIMARLSSPSPRFSQQINNVSARCLWLLLLLLLQCCCDDDKTHLLGWCCC